MATVKMIKGGKYADIFDSPETIAQAKKDGFEIVEGYKPPKTEKVENADSDAGEIENTESSDEEKENTTVKQSKRTVRQ